MRSLSRSAQPRCAVQLLVSASVEALRYDVWAWSLGSLRSIRTLRRALSRGNGAGQGRPPVCLGVPTPHPRSYRRHRTGGCRAAFAGWRRRGCGVLRSREWVRRRIGRPWSPSGNRSRTSGGTGSARVRRPHAVRGTGGRGNGAIARSQPAPEGATSPRRVRRSPAAARSPRIVDHVPDRVRVGGDVLANLRQRHRGHLSCPRSVRGPRAVIGSRAIREWTAFGETIECLNPSGDATGARQLAGTATKPPGWRRSIHPIRTMAFCDRARC
jgi:hypothetical protein